jgi:hypothetical protein
LVGCKLNKFNDKISFCLRTPKKKMEDDEEISKRKRQNLIDKMRQARGKTKPRAPRFVPEIEPEEDPSMVVFRRDFSRRMDSFWRGTPIICE